MSDTGASRRRDLAFALGIIGAASVVIWQARKQPKAPFDPVGAAAVPIATAVAMIALAGVILLRLWLGRSTRGGAQAMFTSSEAVDGTYRVRPALAWVAIALSVGFLAAIPIAGFMVASTVYLAALGWALSERTPRATIIVATIALVAGIGLPYGFRALLVDLP